MGSYYGLRLGTWRQPGHANGNEWLRIHRGDLAMELGADHGRLGIGDHGIDELSLEHGRCRRGSSNLISDWDYQAGTAD